MPDQLWTTLFSLAQALAGLRDERGADCLARLILVDNGDGGQLDALCADPRWAGVAAHFVDVDLIRGQGNVGFGGGHNLALQCADGRYHLILNPDVTLMRNSLAAALSFLDAHADAGLLSPRVSGGDGSLQYLCRRYPTVLDLFGRGFMPAGPRKLLDAHLARYEMRDRIDTEQTVWDVPIVSGCFMLFRTSVLRALDGFDTRYFLYFEDYDLSLRSAALTRTVYVPACAIIHYGGGSARKGLAHIRMFVVSACRFFSRFGWRWW